MDEGARRMTKSEIYAELRHTMGQNNTKTKAVSQIHGNAYNMADGDSESIKAGSANVRTVMGL